MDNKRFIASIVEIIIGFVLIACSIYGVVDEYWNGMGVALLVVGVVFLIRQFKQAPTSHRRRVVFLACICRLPSCLSTNDTYRRRCGLWLE